VGKGPGEKKSKKNNTSNTPELPKKQKRQKKKSQVSPKEPKPKNPQKHVPPVWNSGCPKTLKHQGVWAARETANISFEGTKTRDTDDVQRRAK